MTVCDFSVNDSAHGFHHPVSQKNSSALRSDQNSVQMLHRFTLDIVFFLFFVIIK